MLIRCSRCKALWSLQDGIVQDSGPFKVECGRCLQVFAAEPPKHTGLPTSAPLERHVLGAFPTDVRAVDPALETSSPRSRSTIVALAALLLIALALLVWKLALSGGR